jgi:hypothetical protein
MVEMRSVYKILVGIPIRYNNSEDLCIKVRIILEVILEGHDGKLWTRLSGSGKGPVAGCYEHGNETSSYIKVWQLLG